MRDHIIINDQEGHRTFPLERATSSSILQAYHNKVSPSKFQDISQNLLVPWAPLGSGIGQEADEA